MLNRCEFIGNLGRDPEVRSTQSGDKVASLSIAVSEAWKDKNTGEKRERTEWVPITIWGPLAKVAEQYLRKGSKIYVAGKFQTRKWQDQSGNDRWTTDVVLQGTDAKMIMLGGTQERAGGPHGGSGGNYDADHRRSPVPVSGQQGCSVVDDDEIPF